MKKSFVRIVGLVVTVVFSLVFSSTAMAVECKGLSKAKCEKADDCSWVNTYKTKTGSTVEAYCRSKPTTSAQKKTTSKKKASNTKKESTTTKKKETKKKSSSKKKETKKKSSSKEKEAKKKSGSKKKKGEKKS